MSTGNRDLLVEIGCEELPPKALLRLAQHFADGISQRLTDAGIPATQTIFYAAPRRLAVWASNVPEGQEDRTETRRGPAVTAAYDDEGCPTPAATGFARSCGVAVEDLEKLETDKGSWLACTVEHKGAATGSLLGDIINDALGALPIPKRMRWGAGDEEFVRPVHWIVLIYGDGVIKTPVLGITPGQETRGHRFHHPGPIFISDAAAYAPVLESEGHVLVDINARREAIRGQVMERAREAGGTAVIDDDLLEEVTALVEWPVALSGKFDPEFLDVPAEALVSSMQDHQKYFPVVDTDGRLLPTFVTVANIESRDPEQVRAGNERVIRPRLSDAAFFWNQDRKQPLASRAEALKTVVFQKKLGSLHDKQERVAALAGFIAGKTDTDKCHAQLAAGLSKCDLLTQMVYEFPELQGIMGRHYALHDGHPDDVAVALDEQYMPRFAGDDLPATNTGRCLAIADRVDTLLGIFAIGQPPTGDRDPFGLRRAALGVLRIMIEGELDLDLEELLAEAAAKFSPELDAASVTAATFDFILERLRAYYADSGISAQTFDAVHARRPTQPLDFHRRIQAVKAFAGMDAADSLSAANKRIRNILRKNTDPVPESVDTGLLLEQAERDLAGAIDDARKDIAPLLERHDYAAALTRLASLRDPVDRFFDDVMVMAEDPVIRGNRLALLQDLGNQFLVIADISRLQG